MLFLTVLQNSFTNVRVCVCVRVRVCVCVCVCVGPFAIFHNLITVCNLDGLSMSYFWQYFHNIFTQFCIFAMSSLSVPSLICLSPIADSTFTILHKFVFTSALSQYVYECPFISVFSHFQVLCSHNFLIITYHSQYPLVTFRRLLNFLSLVIQCLLIDSETPIRYISL